MKEACVGCGHDIEMHFQNVLGKARCLVTERGVSSSGVIGLPWEVACDCIDYHSEIAEAKKRRDEEERRREKQWTEALVQRLVDDGSLGGRAET